MTPAKLVKSALTPPLAAISAVIFAALGARAELLVYEGFSMNDYTGVAAGGTVGVANAMPKKRVDAIGTSSEMWNGMGGSQIMVFGTNYGLGYSREISLVATGGSLGLNPQQNNSDLRAAYHSLASDVLKVSSGKLYISMLLNADSVALGKLAQNKPTSSHFGFGICVKPTANSVWTLLATQPSALSFMIWKNSSGAYQLSLFVTDSNKGQSQADICTVTAGMTYLCYAEIDIGAGADGKEVIKAGAVAQGENSAYDWPASVESDFITDASYPTAMAVAGPYGTNSGRFRADEVRIGTTPADVLPIADVVAVTGFPAEYGTPVPGYGATFDVRPGETYTFNPPADGEAEDVKWHCTGWEFVTESGKRTNDTGAAEITYEERGTLTWIFDRQFKVTAVSDDPTKGTVSLDSAWCAEGQSVTLTATPAPGWAMASVGGDLTLDVRGQDSVRIPVTGPTSIIVGFAPVRYVAEDGDDTKDGYGPDTAFATITNALASLASTGEDIGILHIGEGTFFVPHNNDKGKGGACVEHGVRIVGAGPEKTIVTLEASAKQGRIFYVNHAKAFLSGMTITGAMGFSERWFYGSAVFIDTAGGTISNAVIRGNNFAYICQNGGAIGLTGSKSLLTHSVVSNNGYTAATPAGGQAGGVYVADGTVESCLIVDNRGLCGAGIGIGQDSAAKVRNCTVAFNHAIVDKATAGTGRGGGLARVNNSGVKFTVVNTIFCGNRADDPTGSAGGEEYEAPASPATFNARFTSCGFGNATGVTPAGTGAKQLGADCFRDSASGDFTLARGSAAIDGGTVYVGLPAKDLAGNDRIIGEMPDIGCYEFDTTAFACGIGVSDEALFLGGTVTFTANVYGVGEGDEVAYAWTLKDAAGATVATSSERVFAYLTANPGALSAYLTVTADGKGACSDECPGAVMVRPRDLFVVEANENAREPYEDWEHAGTNLVDMLAYAVDGQTIHLGEGTFFGPHNTIDAAFNVAKALTVVGAGPERTILTLDPAAKQGRVLRVANRNALVTGMTITGGKGYSARNFYGSGVIIDTAGGTISNAVIRGNNFAYTIQGGGAIIVNGANSLLTHSVVSNNGYTASSPSGSNAGGVYVADGTVESCLIVDNRSLCGAGIGIGQDSASKVRNCTVAFNHAIVEKNTAGTGRGGGLSRVNNIGVKFTVVNTIFCGNRADDPTGSAGGEEYEAPSNPTTFNARFTSCGFGNATGVTPAGTGAKQLGADCFRDSASGDFTLARGSAAIDGGADYAGLPAKDLAGNDRIIGAMPDIGCYEFDTTAFACGIEVSDEALFLGGTVTFTANVYGVGEGDEVAYAWTLKDAAGATVATSSERVFVYLTANPGALSAYLTVTADGKGACSDECPGAVMVRPRDLFVVEANENARAPYEDWEHAGTNLVDMLAYAVDGQTIHLGEGTFFGPHNTVDAAFNVAKALTVVGAGPERTILTLDPAAKQGRVLRVANRNALVTGMTITGGKGYSERWFYGSGAIIDTAGGTVSNAVIRGNNFAYICQSGGAISVDGANSLLTHSVVSNNGYTASSPAGEYAGGVYVADGTVENCLIVDNRSCRGAGVGIGQDSAAKVRNCTVAFNHAIKSSDGTGRGGGLSRVNNIGVKFTVVNTIFCGNRADDPTGSAGGEEYEAPASPATFNKCFTSCGFAAAAAAGVGSVSVDDVASACFEDAEHGNFALSHRSPFYKSGVYQAWMDGATDLADQPRLLRYDRKLKTWLVDMGCYESPWFGPGFLLMVR